MDPAESFKDGQPSIFDEIRCASNKKEVILQHFLTFQQFLLSCIKVIVDVQTLNKFCNWISMGIRLLHVHMCEKKQKSNITNIT